MKSSLSFLLLLPLTLAFGACAPELSSSDDFDCEGDRCDVASRRHSHAATIRDSAARAGLTNSVLLAGIGEVETNLAHCWSEAKWACKGPASASCGGGPVIAGSADGACSLQQGGLGMFQFDAGTYSQTIAKYGNDIVTLEGNVGQVVPFLVERAIESVSGINSEQEALDWMNSIQVVDGDPDFEEWLRFVSWRYNGCKGCTSQENKYRTGTHLLQQELGSEFWGSSTNVGDYVAGESGSFIGADCAADPFVCDYTVSGEEGECVDWFSEDDGALHGFCSSSCEGFCPDKPGESKTFCANLEETPGMCASLPDSGNGFCDDVEGTTMQVVARYVGNSSAVKVWRAICAPPGNETTCSSPSGEAGECYDTDVMQCGETLYTGQCPGGVNIRCCAP